MVEEREEMFILRDQMHLNPVAVDRVLGQVSRTCALGRLGVDTHAEETQ